MRVTHEPDVCSGVPPVYHGTSRYYLLRIAKQGLIPQRGPSELWRDPSIFGTPALFFGIRPSVAQLWGSTILRFPLPEVYFPDPSAEAALRIMPFDTQKEYKAFVTDDGRTYFAWYTTEAVPAENIALWHRNKWRPLKVLLQA